jgi:hypothetical protein
VTQIYSECSHQTPLRSKPKKIFGELMIASENIDFRNLSREVKNVKVLLDTLEKQILDLKKDSTENKVGRKLTRSCKEYNTFSANQLSKSHQVWTLGNLRIIHLRLT